MTRTAALAAYLRARPGVWIDGRELAPVGGAYAWRTRVSELRRAPLLMAIANRQRRIMRPDGTSFVVSEYRYTPVTQAAPRQMRLLEETSECRTP